MAERKTYTAEAPISIAAGDRVKAPSGPDGTVDAITGGRALVLWSHGLRSWWPLIDLTLVERGQ